MSITLLFFLSLYLFSLSLTLYLFPSLTNCISYSAYPLHTLHALHFIRKYAAVCCSHTYTQYCAYAQWHPKEQRNESETYFSYSPTCYTIDDGTYCLKTSSIFESCSIYHSERKKEICHGGQRPQRQHEEEESVCHNVLPVACRHWQPVHIDYPASLPPTPTPLHSALAIGICAWRFN